MMCLGRGNHLHSSLHLWPWGKSSTSICTLWCPLSWTTTALVYFTPGDLPSFWPKGAGCTTRGAAVVVVVVTWCFSWTEEEEEDGTPDGGAVAVAAGATGLGLCTALSGGDEVLLEFMSLSSSKLYVWEQLKKGGERTYLCTWLMMVNPLQLLVVPNVRYSSFQALCFFFASAHLACWDVCLVAPSQFKGKMLVKVPLHAAVTCLQSATALRLKEREREREKR